MKVELFEVYYINGHLAIKLSALAKMVNYSDSFLLRFFKKLLRKGIYIAYKWKRNWYILLPKTPITKVSNPEIQKPQPDVKTEFPNGKSVEFNWQDIIQESPPAIREFFLKSVSKLIIRETRLFMVWSITQTGLNSSTLSPKNQSSFIPLSLGKFPATTDYKNGYYIYYDLNKMSIFDPGVDGTLKSTQLPQAFFEICRALEAAENARNGANPGITPRDNISTTISFDSGAISVAATIPVVSTVQADGTMKVVASDYVGGAYSAFDGGGGDLKSSNLVAAFLEISNVLSLAEKAIQPIADQPDNIQINIDKESDTATISANLPFTTSPAANGDVIVSAIDYL